MSMLQIHVCIAKCQCPSPLENRYAYFIVSANSLNLCRSCNGPDSLNPFSSPVRMLKQHHKFILCPCHPLPPLSRFLGQHQDLIQRGSALYQHCGQFIVKKCLLTGMIGQVDGWVDGWVELQKIAHKCYIGSSIILYLHFIVYSSEYIIKKLN